MDHGISKAAPVQFAINNTPESRGENMALTSTFNQSLDTSDTLCQQSLCKGSPRTATRLVRGVLLAIGIALCSASPAGMAQPLPKLSPIKYSEFQIGKQQTKCLFAIAKRESNIRFDAYNRSGAYGAWQIKNYKIAKLSPLKQVDWAIKYANHRYGSPCKAWARWKELRWW